MEVTEITDLHAHQIAQHLPEPVRFGSRTDTPTSYEGVYNAILTRQRNQHQRAFLLVWEGSRVPRNALVEGKPIGWTQHGIVVSTSGERLGVYTRLVDSSSLQIMIIYTPY